MERKGVKEGEEENQQMKVEDQYENRESRSRQSCSQLSFNQRTTHILFFSFDLDKVSRTSMTPPKLSRDTPILNVIHPSKEFPLIGLWSDDHSLRFDGFDSFLCQRFTIDPPLRFHDLFNDVSRTRTNR